jgi:hypothetical protein
MAESLTAASPAQLRAAWASGDPALMGLVLEELGRSVLDGPLGRARRLFVVRCARFSERGADPAVAAVLDRAVAATLAGDRAALRAAWAAPPAAAAKTLLVRVALYPDAVLPLAAWEYARGEGLTAAEAAAWWDDLINPFWEPGPPPEGAPRLLASRLLAATAAGAGDYSLLPVLADALEEAGCADAAVLAHCRRPQPHGPGCWVVEWLLGRDGRYPDTDPPEETEEAEDG